MLEPLRAHPACERADEAGSLRRRAETVGDVDVIAAATDGPALTAWLVEQPFVAEVLGQGTTKASVLTHNGVQLDLRVVPPESYGNLLQHFTGSKGHNVRMREDAQRRGKSVSEWGIEDVESGEVFRTGDEDEVYRHLGYEPIPPELREDNGELELARQNELPELVELGDMRGDLHLHSDWSGDGKHPLLDVVAAVRRARPRVHGDHRPLGGRRHGHRPRGRRRAPPDRGGPQLIRETLDDFDLLAGCEVDVMGDGSLYLPDDLLGELDWVVASLHVAQRQDSDRITKRLLAAAEHPCVDVIGHPSGRLIGKREGYAFDVEALVAACATHGTFLEINCAAAPARPAAGARTSRARGGRQARDLDRRPPPRLRSTTRSSASSWRGARARRATTSSTRARWREIAALRKPGRVARDVSDPDKSGEGLVFVSTGRRLAAAKVGRRWHEVRGPLMIGAALASLQALLLFVVLRMLQDQGASLRWFVPDRRADDARARRLAGSRARRLRPRRAARPGARRAPSSRRSRPCAAPLRGGFDAASAQVVAYETRERLGYARGVGRATASTCWRTPASAPTTTAPACRPRRAPSTRCSSVASRACRWAGSTAATAATARCARPSSRRS